MKIELRLSAGGEHFYFIRNGILSELFTSRWKAIKHLSACIRDNEFNVIDYSRNPKNPTVYTLQKSKILTPRGDIRYRTTLIPKPNFVEQSELNTACLSHEN